MSLVDVSLNQVGVAVTPRTDAAVERMERNHTPSWPKVVEAEFARELELEIASVHSRQAAELNGVASLLADLALFLGDLPADLGSAKLNGQKALLRERIGQLAGR